jgi:hypothetical protein
VSDKKHTTNLETQPLNRFHPKAISFFDYCCGDVFYRVRVSPTAQPAPRATIGPHVPHVKGASAPHMYYCLMHLELAMCHEAGRRCCALEFWKGIFSEAPEHPVHG